MVLASIASPAIIGQEAGVRNRNANIAQHIITIIYAHCRFTYSHFEVTKIGVIKPVLTLYLAKSKPVKLVAGL